MGIMVVFYMGLLYYLILELHDTLYLQRRLSVSKLLTYSLIDVHSFFFCSAGFAQIEVFIVSL